MGSGIVFFLVHHYSLAKAKDWVKYVVRELGIPVLYRKDTGKAQPMDREEDDFLSPWVRWLPKVDQDLVVSATSGNLGMTWKELREQVRNDRLKDARERAMAAIAASTSARETAGFSSSAASADAGLATISLSLLI